MSLANISIVGNLVKPPEQMYFASGRCKTTMVVAINTPPRGNRATGSTDFYKVEAWGRLGELAGKYLQKGNQVCVTGRFTLDHWTDKHGNNRLTPIVEATQLAFPPKLQVVDNDLQAAEQIGVNPIGGEVTVQDEEEGEDVDDTVDDTSYGTSFRTQGQARSPA